MEIKVNDFNYYVSEGGLYQFYFLGSDNKIKFINNYGVNIDPMVTIKTLTLNGLRYNPVLSKHGRPWV